MNGYRRIDSFSISTDFYFIGLFETVNGMAGLPVFFCQFEWYFPERSIRQGDGKYRLHLLIRKTSMIPEVMPIKIVWKFRSTDNPFTTARKIFVISFQQIFLTVDCRYAENTGSKKPSPWKPVIPAHDLNLVPGLKTLSPLILKTDNPIRNLLPNILANTRLI